MCMLSNVTIRKYARIAASPCRRDPGSIGTPLVRTQIFSQEDRKIGRQAGRLAVSTTALRFTNSYRTTQLSKQSGAQFSLVPVFRSSDLPVKKSRAVTTT